MSADSVPLSQPRRGRSNRVFGVSGEWQCSNAVARMVMNDDAAVVDVAWIPCRVSGGPE